MKRCYRCRVEKSLTDLGRCSTNKEGKHSYCRECDRAYRQERKALGQKSHQTAP
jgi:hypothetical protein